jgi:NADH-quinone oxidoreductase subunit B
MELQKVVDRQTIKKDAHWYKKEPAQPIPIPILGPDLIDLRKLDQIRLTSEKPAEPIVEPGENKNE